MPWGIDFPKGKVVCPSTFLFVPVRRVAYTKLINPWVAGLHFLDLSVPVKTGKQQFIQPFNCCPMFSAYWDVTHSFFRLAWFIQSELWLRLVVPGTTSGSTGGPYLWVATLHWRASFMLLQSPLAENVVVWDGIVIFTKCTCVIISQWFWCRPTASLIVGWSASAANHPDLLIPSCGRNEKYSIT